MKDGKEMSSTTSKNVGHCPECGTAVRFKKPPLVGQRMSCRRCQTPLEVIARNPIELVWADDEAQYDEPVKRSDKRPRPRRQNRDASFHEDF